LLLYTYPCFAQQKLVSFAEIDERVKSVAPAPPAELAYTLTKDYSTEKEKLRSIFSWIADHISYRVKKNYGSGKLAAGINRLQFTDTAHWKSANDVVAETVLQNTSAVCDGYARLFKTLCDYAGLRSAIITGFAKGDLSRQLKFRCNHTWNAVYIDSAWQLLDITWASGYTNYSGDEFVKRFDDTYFLAPPENFMRDHFPDDLRWTLMEKPPFPGEFNRGPYKNKSFTKYSISAYTPGSGIIEAAVGDTVEIMLESFNPQADSRMAADTVTAFDSVLQRIVPSIALLEPVSTSKDKTHLRYQFCVENTHIQWLHVVYNHDTILRYRLKINKEKISIGLAAGFVKGPVPTTFYP
jgi:hypothetical protein